MDDYSLPLPFLLQKNTDQLRDCLKKVQEARTSVNGIAADVLRADREESTELYLILTYLDLLENKLQSVIAGDLKKLKEVTDSEMIKGVIYGPPPSFDR